MTRAKQLLELLDLDEEKRYGGYVKHRKKLTKQDLEDQRARAKKWDKEHEGEQRQSLKDLKDFKWKGGKLER